MGGACNVAKEYATKRYRSNLINWGMLPFVCNETFEKGELIFIPNIREGVLNGKEQFDAFAIKDGKVRNIVLSTGSLTNDEREIIADGCLMNYYKQQAKK